MQSSRAPDDNMNNKGWRRGWESGGEGRREGEEYEEGRMEGREEGEVTFAASLLALVMKRVVRGPPATSPVTTSIKRGMNCLPRGSTYIKIIISPSLFCSLPSRPLPSYSLLLPPLLPSILPHFLVPFCASTTERLTMGRTAWRR